MFKSNLFIRTFISTVSLILLYSIAIYFTSVPLIKKATYRLEENSGRTILDNVYNLVEAYYRDIEAYQKLALESRKRGLKDIVSIVESYLDGVYEQYQKGIISEESAKRIALEGISKYRYGNNDYIFIVDYNSTLLSHPDKSRIGSDMSREKDIYGNFFVSDMINTALENKDGGFNSCWYRLGKEKPSERLMFSKNFPKWKWVIGTGTYIDDVDEEVENRKKKMIDELRQIIMGIKVGKTGYLHIFDSHYNTIIYPNPNIEGTNFLASLLDPATNKPLVRELIEASNNENNMLIYKWDKPTDPGHYVYEKIAWVKYFKGFDWYIVSTVYLEELLESSQMLGNRILLVATFVLFLSLGFVLIYVKMLVKPIQTLSKVALRVRDGDLSARSNIKGSDEIGILAEEFDRMIMKLEEHIKTLDAKIAERTTELQLKNLELNIQKERLLKAYRDLKELDRMKSDFMSSVSHELRTPLTSILGFAKINLKNYKKLVESLGDKITDSKVSKLIPKIEENLKIIIEESVKLTALINDVLDLNRLESGKMEWNNQLLNINNIVQNVINIRKDSLVNKSNVELITEVDNNIREIYADKDRIMQVIDNLISNSIKFTERGYIKIRTFEKDKYIQVEVEDTGPGIRTEDYNNIFEKFKQVGDILTDKPKGSGLGLPICKEIIEHYGGSIWVESQIGKGTTFKFTLPIYEQQKENSNS